ncbi:hypothetical protein TrVFT333_004560 [Trichoderma virens FT-333]|nr:hypothetical protein TrVFT333_004560 [Trichoderma virens FT-333]
MAHIHLIVCLLLQITSVALGVSSLDHSTVMAWHDNRDSRLASKWAPIFYFSQSQSKVPCIPEWAVLDDGDGAQNTPVDRCQYPDVGCKCRNPGVGINNAISGYFPTYYTYYKCTDTQIRIQYALYYRKDGFKDATVDYGHGHDWEWVIVDIRKSGNSWAPLRLWMSQHSGGQWLNWGDIQNTSNDPDVGQGHQGYRNEDHPKVYAAWAKHGFFHTRNTGYNDPGASLVVPLATTIVAMIGGTFPAIGLTLIRIKAPKAGE